MHTCIFVMDLADTAWLDQRADLDLQPDVKAALPRFFVALSPGSSASNDSMLYHFYRRRLLLDVERIDRIHPVSWDAILVPRLDDLQCRPKDFL